MPPEKNKMFTFANMERVRQFLISRPAISLAAIAKEIGIHRTMLTGWKNGRLSLPVKYHEPLVGVLAKYGLDDFQCGD
jgi:hypothetical protein